MYDCYHINDKLTNYIVNMIIGEISFCDQVGFNIKSDETKKYVLERLYSKYKLRIITRHFDKFDDTMLDSKSSIVNRPHMLCVRSNGNPYFLYLVKLNFTNYCIFIDKKIQQGYSYPRMIISHFRFNDCLFSDTIFDGEMVKTNDGCWSYLINDLIVHQGQHLMESNLIKRLNIVYETLSCNYQSDTQDICKMVVKKYFHCTEGDYIMNTHINKVNYTCRGIYFKPLFLRFKDILINFDDNLITKVERQKYKHLKSFMLKEDGDKLVDPETSSTSSSSHETVSSITSVCEPSLLRDVDQNIATYLTRRTNLPDVYELLDKSFNSQGYACIPCIKTSKYMRTLFMNKNVIDTIAVTYTKSPNFVKKWIPIIPQNV